MIRAPGLLSWLLHGLTVGCDGGRYGSPHHNRSQSVKTPGSRSNPSGRPNYLCLPQQRSRVASMPNTGVEEEYYRLRHFSITGKGIVNRGDSLKSRRSKSNNSVTSSNSSHRSLAIAFVRTPSQHSPGVIPDNHGMPRSGWLHQESNPGPPECESSELPLPHLVYDWLLHGAKGSLFAGGGHGGVEVRLLSSHLCDPGSILGGVTPGFLHVGIVPDDATGRRAYSGRSPLTTAIRARYPTGSLPDFRMWESYWTIPLAGGFSRGARVSPALAFQRRFILGSHFMSCPGMTGTYGSQLESTGRK
ncbi:hypothetical protein PR048_029251 [Dryococelus australis]|uniref:Uncharacterized protein n=1 Tax=Dryococelus australis TaxID=614101 RepID=A0ABQ9GCW1_9NEOP|nr:hypothetical protein PR048_029251 [Dryococelus australis]